MVKVGKRFDPGGLTGEINLKEARELGKGWLWKRTSVSWETALPISVL